MAPTQLQELISRLTPRQVEIVELLARGCSRRETASILSISTETVKSHIRKMCNKVEADNRIQLIVMFVVWKIERENHEEKI